MPAVPFGAVKILQKRTGAESKSCKEALAATDLNEDAAVAYLAQRNLVAEGSPAAIAAAAPQAACGDGCARNRCGGDEGASFLSILRIDPGDGDTFPHAGDRLTMHYRGTLDDGTEFDSSHKRNKPFSFTVGKGSVIRGWDEGVLKLSRGERAMLIMSSDYAYGAQGAGDGAIPPYATLKFELELLEIERLQEGDRRLHKADMEPYKDIARQMLGME